MQPELLESAKILIVDDELVNIRLLERHLERANCFNVESTTDSREVVDIFLRFSPDLILLDLMMPYFDGFQIMEQLKELIPDETYLPILVLTADVATQTRRKALAAGAKDFLTKPFDAVELMLRIWNVLETRSLHLKLQDQKAVLQERVRERTLELEDAQTEILKRLSRAAEYRDDETGQHTQRVGQMSALLAHALELPAETVELIGRAAPLHDVGKIGIPDNILLKPGKLTDEEFALMKTHTSIGAALLAGGQADIVQIAEQIAHTHHERWDGTGYPSRLSGEEIPLTGRIVSIVDVFDALTHERPYKKAWPVEDALREIEEQEGRQFSPDVVKAFLKLQRDGDLATYGDLTA